MRQVAVLVALLVPSLAAAQRSGPQACEQEAETADYGEIAVGTVVVLQRHRFVSGDPNWDPRQGRFRGRTARVSRLSGVDQRGCPGVRVDTDEGRFFWRVRDLNIGVGRPTTEPRTRRTAAIPQGCGQSDETARYGRLRVGTQVVLGRHRPVDGDANWSPEMTPFVGRSARIVELAGTDSLGCPGVNVDADGRQWFWRIRDLRSGEGEAPIVYRPGLASDHGRPPVPQEAELIADGRMPQACGVVDDAHAVWGPVSVGTEVVLGRHRAVSGEANWVAEMEPFVNRRARVTELVGVDEQGCALVRVDLDEGDFVWRLRDLHLHAPEPAPPEPTPAAPTPPVITTPPAATPPAATRT